MAYRRWRCRERGSRASGLLVLFVFPFLITHIYATSLVIKTPTWEFLGFVKMGGGEEIRKPTMPLKIFIMMKILKITSNGLDCLKFKL